MPKCARYWLPGRRAGTLHQGPFRHQDPPRRHSPTKTAPKGGLDSPLDETNARPRARPSRRRGLRYSTHPLRAAPRRGPQKPPRGRVPQPLDSTCQGCAVDRRSTKIALGLPWPSKRSATCLERGCTSRCSQQIRHGKPGSSRGCGRASTLGKIRTGDARSRGGGARRQQWRRGKRDNPPRHRSTCQDRTARASERWEGGELARSRG
mmetsp:Transcript_24229/g.55728  ORF Transcript_24229/g.55728 Transcript_24229/m.55728 type:complete len:207 (-) Transcript_24229:132-752(-)